MKNKSGEIWMEWVWPGYHWYQGINPMLAYQEDMPKLGYIFSKMAVTYSKGTEAYYFILSEYEQNGAKFFEVVKKNPKLLFNVLDKVNFAAEMIFGLGKKWENVDVNKLTNRQLLDYHRTIFKWDAPLWRNGQVPNLLELHNSFLSEHIKLIVKKNFPQSEQELFKIITTPTYNSVTEQQDHDFLKLVKKRSNKLVVKHWKKYTWMNYGWSGPAFNYDYFLKNYKKALNNRLVVKKIQAKIHAKEVILKEQKKLLTKFMPKDKELVVLLRAILEQKSRRVDAHSLTYFWAEKIMKEIGSRVGLSLNQMRMVAPNEVPRLFKKINIDEINQEYNRVLYWYENSKLSKFSGSVANKKLNYVIKRLPKVEIVKQLVGELAYSGKVSGRVRIILDIREKGRFKQGEVLVTRMTDPSYMSIMKIAKAVVTDVGGITCHAAIVARELGIPCIIGTKFATKVFKDGDVVEVDANNGIIRKI